MGTIIEAMSIYVLYKIPSKYGVAVTTSLAGEQHGKGKPDGIFGVTHTWMREWTKQRQILNIGDLVECYKAGADKAMAVDPTGDKYIIEAFDPGEFQPCRVMSLVSADVHISRTYCMTSKPDKRRHLGVMVQNHVFDDAFNPRSPSVSLAEKVHADNGDSLRWTRGYFQEEPWNAPAMKPGDASELLQGMRPSGASRARIWM